MKRAGLFLLMVFWLVGVAPVYGAGVDPRFVYNLIGLPPLPGYAKASAQAINNNGEVVGNSYNDNFGPSRPTYWGPSNSYKPQDLGSLGGDHGGALGINDGGYIVGWCYDINNYQLAFICNPVSLPIRQLTSLFDSPYDTAWGINIHGAVAGRSKNFACVWHDYTPVQLHSGNPADWGTAYGVNDLGLNVGSGLPGTGYSQPCVWEHGACQFLTPLDTPGGGAAVAVNSSSQVAGYYYSATASNTHAFIWDKFNGLRDLGTLGGNASYARAINKQGIVVGEANLTDDNVKLYPFIYLDNQLPIKDLNNGIIENNYAALQWDKQSWNLLTASGINDRSYIVGQMVAVDVSPPTIGYLLRKTVKGLEAIDFLLLDSK
jgi:uncharacterized membrane protein